MANNPKFETGEIYHIFNRGVEKRDIYSEESDYYRFVYSLYECNDENAFNMRDRIDQRIKRNKNKSDKGATFVTFEERKERELLVEVLGFTLMPNHYHLIVRQIAENGISLFMKKMGNTYVPYFNKKYNREGMGSIFQGRFKAVHVETDEQFIYLVWYVFTNSLDLLKKDWRKEGIKDAQKAIKHLNSYKWSSYLDCVGIKNFPSVTSRDFLMDNFDGQSGIKDFIEERIFEEEKIKDGLAKIKNLILE
jgi:putative transposase